MGDHRDDNESVHRTQADRGAGRAVLTEHDSLPPGILDMTVDRLRAYLSGPTLVHLPGLRTPPLLVAVPVPDDDGCGWNALRTLLRRRSSTLPRALSVLFLPARDGAGAQTTATDTAETRDLGEGASATLARALGESMRRRGMHAAVEVCGHRGAGPPYAEVADMRPEVLGLARGFGPLAVIRQIRGSSAIAALRTLAPALRIDCGDSRDPHGMERIAHFLERRLTESALPHALPNALQLFACVAHIRVVAHQAFSFDGVGPLQLRGDLESSNFRRLPAGTLLARQTGGSIGLEAHDMDGNDVTAAYLDYSGHEIRLRREVFPSEYSADVDVVRKRGLCCCLQPWVDRRFPPVS
jgi:hypothetical protein